LIEGNVLVRVLVLVRVRVRVLVLGERDARFPRAIEDD
jgi:hypothetical protein